MPRLHASTGRRGASVVLAALALGAAPPLAAPPLAAQERQPAPFTRRVDVSGVLFGNFQYHAEPGTDAAEDEQVRAGRERNQFSLDRAYVNVRAAVAPRTNVRVTSDLFRADDGYELRVKYGYVDHRVLDRDDVSAFVRAGLLQNVVIDHEERFWPRWLGTAPTDRAGYFSSADVGVAVGATLPRQLGELYATVVNGQGYQRVGEADDRFKDWAARLSLTPLAGREEMPAVLRGIVVSPWAYWGDTASAFGPDSPRADTPGYLGAIGAGRERLRWGLFVGWEDERYGTAGMSLSRRRSEMDAGDNTAASPATTFTRTEKLASAFAAVRPLALYDPSWETPLSLVLRYDRHDADRAAAGFTHYVVAGLAYELDDHLSVALDYQETLPQDGQPPTRATLRQIYFAHLEARF